jgi:hypothetical protein
VELIAILLAGMILATRLTLNPLLVYSTKELGWLEEYRVYITREVVKPIVRGFTTFVSVSETTDPTVFAMLVNVIAFEPTLHGAGEHPPTFPW